ncbi:MAG: hypothetical protein WKF92_00690 [Pyrinomonadaceae bacterium]
MQEPEFITGVINPIEVYKEAWVMIKDQYWIIFAITFVGLMISGVVPLTIGNATVRSVNPLQTGHAP